MKLTEAKHLVDDLGETISFRGERQGQLVGGDMELGLAQASEELCQYLKVHISIQSEL